MTKLDRWYDLATTRIFDRLRSPLLLALRLIFGWGLFQTGKGKLENIDRFIALIVSTESASTEVFAAAASSGVIWNKTSFRPRISPFGVKTTSKSWGMLSKNSLSLGTASSARAAASFPAKV